jgi:protein-L-isoaspartate(D-aspartate) O-methyltransferase
METSAHQQVLVDELKNAGQLHDPRVEAAFRAVPRQLFLPGVPPEEVYRDAAIVTRRANDQPISSSSQPAIMAIMLEQLDVRPGQQVLEIGAGTGYNAALLAHLVGDEGSVVTVDIDQDIVDDARQHLAAAGFDQVKVVCGDGSVGYAEAAPYDRIILTVGAPDILPAWREQLKPPGRLVLPLSIRLTQESIAFELTGDCLTGVSIVDCSFMMLRGAAAGPAQSFPLGPEAGLHFTSHQLSELDREALYQQLVDSSRDWPTTVRVTGREVWGGLNVWLDLHEDGFCQLWAEGEMATRRIIPCLFGFQDCCFTHGLANKDSLCLLMRSPVDEPQAANDSSFDLFVRGYGRADMLAQQLIEQVRAWDTAERPGTDRLRVRAYPQNSSYRPAAHEVVVQKLWTRLILDWPS